MEHHANIVPWQMACERTGAQLNYIPIDKNGELDLSNPDKLFSKATKIISVTHVSNVLGTINPIKKLSKIAKSLGAIFVVDGAQGVPHQPVDVQDLSCDFYAFSGHKMLGPTGVGVLWGKTEILDQMEPFMGGGENDKTVTMESQPGTTFHTSLNQEPQISFKLWGLGPQLILWKKLGWMSYLTMNAN